MTFGKQKNMHDEINIKLVAANRCYFALANLFRSKLILKKKQNSNYYSLAMRDQFFHMSVPLGQLRKETRKSS